MVFRCVLNWVRLVLILGFFIMLKVLKFGSGIMLKNLVFRCIGCRRLFIDRFLKNGLVGLLNVLCGVLNVVEIM